MHEAVFTLRQETPIIHFLHDQPGATLRATELKPKLDRFILEAYRTNFIEAATRHAPAICRLRKAVKDKLPSPYKMEIQQETGNGETQFYYFESRFTTDEREYLPKILKEKLGREALKIAQPSPYFANNDKRKDKKWDEIRLGVLFTGNILVRTKTWDTEMDALLKETLPLLLCLENFGMRQSKGFGCFSETSVSVSLFEETVRDAFVFSAKKSRPTSQLDIFKTINDTYKNLRNNPPDESALRDFFAEQSSAVEWEKHRITEEVVYQDSYTPQHPVEFVRAMLGLPGLHDYPKGTVKAKVNIRHTSNEVERYKSPIMFKVFKDKLYLLAEDVNPDMLGQKFVFYVGDDPAKTNRKIEIPTPTNFSIEGFLSDKLPNNWQNV
jgi:hypothetical protein